MLDRLLISKAERKDIGIFQNHADAYLPACQAAYVRPVLPGDRTRDLIANDLATVRKREARDRDAVRILDLNPNTAGRRR